LVRVVDLAVVDPARVDVERKAEQLARHYRAFEVPARRTAPPGRIPFHLPRLARRGLAPDGKVGGVALALDGIDPAFPFIGLRTRQPPVIGDGRDVEIEPAFQFVAVLWRDGFREVDHLGNVVGSYRPLGRLADV